MGLIRWLRQVLAERRAARHSPAALRLREAMKGICNDCRSMDHCREHGCVIKRTPR
jgi:hypothetical protein